ncbi:MAG: PD40 domain-containing protein [Bryobacterales bacterium]|nr:PD40 domain-containing protein [Bryobacterales bacterium]
MKLLVAPALLLAATAGAPRAVWTAPGATHLGAPSPDGRFLSGIHPDSGELLLRDLTSGIQRRLGRKQEPHEFAYFSVFSRDSAHVAYAWSNARRFYELRLADTSTLAERTLYSNEEAGFVQPCAFTPDGKHVLTLLFRKDNISQIALISTATGEARVLKSLNWVYPKRMDVSPDGKWIVYDNFAREGATQRDLFLLAVDGSREERLLENPADDLFPVFSRDGRHIYFSSDRDGGTPGLWRVALTEPRTAAPELIQPGLGRFLVQGITAQNRLYYGLRVGAANIYQAGFDPASGKLTTRADAVGEGYAAAWSPDGSQLAWLARLATENFGTDARTVSIRQIASGETQTYGPKLAHMESLDWTAAGGLRVSGSDGKGRGGVFLLALPGGSAKAVTVEPGAPHTGFLASGAYHAKGKELWRAGGEAPVATFPRAITALSVAPDGATVAVAQETTLTIVGQAESRAASQPIHAMAWTGDGKYLVTVQNDELWCWPRSLASTTRVAKTAAPIGTVSLHPRNHTILFTAGRPRSEVWALDLP